MINLKKQAILQEIDIKRQEEGILSGWEIAIKDNVNVENTLTTGSSHLLANHQSIYNATIIEKLLDSGAHLVAKTSLDELAMGGSNRTAATGPVPNPYDVLRISGGSSGGSAALVGSGMVRAAVGTDTGDSIRKPAAYCGVVGIKPTYGRISRYGVIPYASSLDHVGVFSQNVKDAAVLLNIMAGRDHKDMSSSFETVEDYTSLLDMDLEGKRIGVFKSIHDSIENEETLKIYQEFEEKLKASGAVIVEKEMDLNLLKSVLGTYAIIANAEASSNHANLDGVRFGKQVSGDDLENTMMQTRGQGFGLDTKKRFIFGGLCFKYGKDEILFNKAKRVRRLIVEAYANMFEDIDVLISIAAPNIAPLIDEMSRPSLTDEYLIADNYMAIDNLSGFPSMTIPLGFQNELPMGLNISTRPFEETGLLAFANEFEKIIDWKGRFF